MRSYREVHFRLRQELRNAWLFLSPPEFTGTQAAPLAALPDCSGAAALIRGSRYEEQLIGLGEQIMGHRFPLLGLEVDTGPDISWRKDYGRGLESGLRYFRFVPYLDVEQVGDQKIVWELNRHQHLPLLAQCWQISGEERYLAEIFRQLVGWWEQNPFQQGMNWTAALEVAFRTLSWIWVYHLAGVRMDPNFRRRFLTELYRHGCHLEWNLSVYSSPNTHLLGEAVALHAVGALFPSFPSAARWKRMAAAVVRSHMETHVREDGSYFEQSSYYHVYALDLFLFHALMEPAPDSYRTKLVRMARYVAELQGYSRLLPILGDDDGGRTFHPYGKRNQFGRASLATAALFLGTENLGFRSEDRLEQALWWLGPEKLRASPASQAWEPQSCRFADSGVAVMAADDLQVILDAGPFGTGTAGHSHSDTLSVLVRKADDEILVDAGTFAYLADVKARNWFRGTAAHNTIRIDGREQADPSGLFRWSDPPRVETTRWLPDRGSGMDYLDAAVYYEGFTHRRRVALLRTPKLLFVLDEVSAATPGEHLVEQFWHWGAGAACGARLFTTHPELMSVETGGEHGWHAPAFGCRHPTMVSRLAYRGVLPAVFGTVLDVLGREGHVELFREPTGWRMCFAAGRRWEVVFLEGQAELVESTVGEE